MTWISRENAVEQFAGPCNIEGHKCAAAKVFISELISNKLIDYKHDGEGVILSQIEEQANKTIWDYHLENWK